MTKDAAFTLIELLVVTSIIGILAGLLLPSLSTAKKRGLSAACVNNLHQLGIAVQMYWDDNHGKISALSDIFPGLDEHEQSTRLDPGALPIPKGSESIHRSGKANMDPGHPCSLLLESVASLCRGGLSRERSLHD